MDAPENDETRTISGANNRDPVFYKEKGNHFFEQKRYDEAIKCYIKSLECDPEYADSWYNLGKTLYMIGKDKEAKQCLDRFRILSKNSSQPTISDNQKVESSPNSLSINQKNLEEGRLHKSGLFSAFSGIISTLFGVKTRKELEDARNITEKKDLILKPLEEFRSDATIQIPKSVPNQSKISIIPSVPTYPSAPSIPSRFEISINFENGDEIQEYSIKSSFAKDELIFAGPGQTIAVGQYSISDPLTYWSDGSVKIAEASCINIRLPIGVEVEEDKKAMSYYPQYSQITPDQRANYLAWLSTGKSSDLTNIGYAFIYFYGLERRALIDKKDLQIIVPEVIRLLYRYSSSGSFNGYLREFLAYVVGSFLEKFNEQTILQLFHDSSELKEKELITVLAWYCMKNIPIPWQVAFSASGRLSKIPQNVAYKRVKRELKLLFEKQYMENYPQGLLLVSSKNLYKMEYRAASPSLSSYRYNHQYPEKHILLSNPLGKPSQFSQIIRIYEEGIETLKPFGQKIQKANGTMSAEAYLVLPDILKEHLEHPDKLRWDSLFNLHKKRNFGIISIGELCELVNIEKREILTPSQCKTLASIGLDIGYQLIPDQKISGKPYRWDELIALHPIDLNKRKFTDNYYAAALIYDLALSVAISDGPLTVDEIEHLKQNISKDLFTLDEFELSCLNAYQAIRLLQPELIEKLTSRLKEHLTGDQRITIGKYLIDIAIYDNLLTNNEQKTLKKLLKAMEIDPITSDTLIAEALFSMGQENPVVLQKGVKIRKGEPIPSIAAPKPGIIIDKSKLKNIIDATFDVKEILGQVLDNEQLSQDQSEFEELQKKSEPEIEYSTFNIELLPFSLDSIKKLDSRYYSILYEVLQKNDVKLEEFEELVRSYGCMPEATIEEINTWADEELGDFLLERQNGIIIVNHQSTMKY